MGQVLSGHVVVKPIVIEFLSDDEARVLLFPSDEILPESLHGEPERAVQLRLDGEIFHRAACPAVGGAPWGKALIVLKGKIPETFQIGNTTVIVCAQSGERGWIVPTNASITLSPRTTLTWNGWQLRDARTIN